MSALAAGRPAARRGRGWLTAGDHTLRRRSAFLARLARRLLRGAVRDDLRGGRSGPEPSGHLVFLPASLGPRLAACLVHDARRAGPATTQAPRAMSAWPCCSPRSRSVRWWSSPRWPGACSSPRPLTSGRPDRRRVPGTRHARGRRLLGGQSRGRASFFPLPIRWAWGSACTPGLPSSFGNTLVWHILTYGLLLPLGLSGLFLPRRGRFAAAASGRRSVRAQLRLVCSFVGYRQVRHHLGAGTFHRRQRGGCAGSSRSGPLWWVSVSDRSCLRRSPWTAWPFRSSLRLDATGIPLAMYPKEASKTASEYDLQAIAWLRQRVPPGDLVYRRPPAALAYDHMGGLPVPWFDGLTDTFGFSPERMERRRRLLIMPSPDPDHYDAEGIRWFVLGAAMPPCHDTPRTGSKTAGPAWKPSSAPSGSTD